METRTSGLCRNRSIYLSRDEGFAGRLFGALSHSHSSRAVKTTITARIDSMVVAKIRLATMPVRAYSTDAEVFEG